MIVVGAGKVGFDIAKRLSEEGHDVTLVDRSEENLREAVHHLDIMTLAGNGATPPVLKAAGVEKADILIAVTDIDEVNMIACFTAKQYGVRICCARVRDPEYSAAFTRDAHPGLGIDRVINPDQLAAAEIVRLLQTPAATYVESFADGKITLVQARVGPESRLAGLPLKEAELKNCLVVAIEREEDLFIPDGESVIQPGDKVFLVSHTHDLAAVDQVVGKGSPPAKNVVIVGGGSLGLRLAQILSAKRDGLQTLKVVEINPDRCRELAEILPHAMVICGDGETIDVLRDELVGAGDAFVAVTGKDHTNVLATMVAKELGVTRAITKISREDYALLAEKAGADAVVVPRMILAGTILQMVRRSNLARVALLEDGKGEVLEFEVGPEAEVVGRPLSELPREKDAIVGAILRNGKAFIARGVSVIQPGDRVVVFALPAAVPAVMRRFGAESRRRG